MDGERLGEHTEENEATEVLTLWTAATEQQQHEIHRHIYARDLTHAQDLARPFLEEFCVPMAEARFQQWPGGHRCLRGYYHGRVLVRKGQRPEGWHAS